MMLCPAHKMRRLYSRLERMPRMQNVEYSNASRDSSVIKQIQVAPLTKARQEVCVLLVLGYDHYNLMPLVIVGTLSA